MLFYEKQAPIAIFPDRNEVAAFDRLQSKLSTMLNSWNAIIETFASLWFVIRFSRFALSYNMFVTFLTTYLLTFTKQWTFSQRFSGVFSSFHALFLFYFIFFMVLFRRRIILHLFQLNVAEILLSLAISW